MKAHLLYPGADFDWHWARQAAAERAALSSGYRYARPAGFDPRSGLPWNADDLERDLALTSLLQTMARGDEWIFEVSRRVLLEGVQSDLETILYRQAILRGCLNQPAVVRRLHTLTVQVTEHLKGHALGVLSRYPDWVLRESIDTMAKLLAPLKTLRELADLHVQHFRSEGWATFLAMLKQQLTSEYLTVVESQLNDLKFSNGVLLSAELGTAQKGVRYHLHRSPDRRRAWVDWWKSLFEPKPPMYSFDIAPRDEAGARALAELRDRAIASTASALGQAADHMRDFFTMLRAELSFYIGCLNLHDELARRGYPTCMPLTAPAHEQRMSFQGLYDVALALSQDEPVVANALDADGKNLVFITGPNSGGKSTFLRAIGVAQLMMQAGMFVAADSFRSSLCGGLFTHFKREEDVQMQHGKFDEELSRMSAIIDHVRTDSIMLLNESFAATNEREGSEIARQTIRALTELGVRVFFVTHLFDLAQSFYERRLAGTLFLRAERLSDGRRTYRILEGEPLATSHGEDVYRRVFHISPGSPQAEVAVRNPCARTSQDCQPEHHPTSVSSRDACHARQKPL